MKKILFIHTNYREKGGEDIAFENEINFFKKHFDIEVLKFSNNQINFKDFISFFTRTNITSNKKLKLKIKNFNPDFIYVHNTWFKGSLGLFKLSRKLEIPVLLKLHNFRYFCTRSFSTYKHMTDSENFCRACGLYKKNLGKFNKYFHDSYLKSFFVNLYGRKYFSLLEEFPMKILVLTEFHESFLNSLGIPKKKIFTFPNFINIEHKKNSIKKDKSIVYAGRISNEKGVEELIKSFLNIDNNDHILKIIGVGPSLDNLKNRYKSNKIKFLGELSNNEVLELVKKSKAVVSATKLFEGQPTFLCEASSLSIPSVFPKTGGIDEFFPDNYEFSFNQYDYQDLQQKLENVVISNNLDTKGTEANIFLRNLLDEKKLLTTFKKILNDK